MHQFQVVISPIKTHFHRSNILPFFLFLPVPCTSRKLSRSREAVIMSSPTQALQHITLHPGHGMAPLFWHFLHVCRDSMLTGQPRIGQPYLSTQAQGRCTFAAPLAPPNKPSKIPAVITSFLAESPLGSGRRRVHDLADRGRPGAENTLLKQRAVHVMQRFDLP